jgi:hypothetical protein
MGFYNFETLWTCACTVCLVQCFLVHCCLVSGALLFWCIAFLVHCCLVCLVHCFSGALLSGVSGALLYWCIAFLVHCCLVCLVHCCLVCPVHCFTGALLSGVSGALLSGVSGALLSQQSAYVVVWQQFVLHWRGGACHCDTGSDFLMYSFYQHTHTSIDAV